MRVLNWKPDHPDIRDKRLANQPHTFRGARPLHVDLRAHCSPVVNQGEEGSCTANAGTGLGEFLELKGDPNFTFEAFTQLSRNFLYFNERFLDGDVGEDAGSSLRSCVKAMAHFGSVAETQWPYSYQTLYRSPPRHVYDEAKKHKITKYLRLDGIEDMQRCLYEGFPFLFGFSVYRSFDDIGPDGNMSLPLPNDTYSGGHAVLCVGYNDEKEVAIVRNSWGQNWGDEGYFYMPYEYLTHEDLCDDFWTIRQ